MRILRTAKLRDVTTFVTFKCLEFKSSGIFTFLPKIIRLSSGTVIYWDYDHVAQMIHPRSNGWSEWTMIRRNIARTRRVRLRRIIRSFALAAFCAVYYTFGETGNFRRKYARR